MKSKKFKKITKKQSTAERIKILKARFTEAEHQLIVARCKKLGISVDTFFRLLALEEPIKSPKQFNQALEIVNCLLERLHAIEPFLDSLAAEANRSNTDSVKTQQTFLFPEHSVISREQMVDAVVGSHREIKELSSQLIIVLTIC